LKHHPPAGAIDRARGLRNGSTDAERKLWRMLREAFREHHFRRQVPIRHFIADFASHRAKLVIEVDGGQHGEGIDTGRSAVIESEGYRVIRFWNNEVLGNPDGVWTIIDAALRDHHPTPAPPHQGEGR
jgi:very-short-patch-repair endonuclease